MPRRTATPPPAPAPLLANLPWLDFVNTRYRDRDRWVDAIPAPQALAAWLKAAGLAPDRPGALRSLRGGLGGRALLREAHTFRAALAELVRALVSGTAPPGTAVDAINRVLRAGPTYPELRTVGGRFTRRTVAAGRDPLALLAPVAESAAAFLEAGDRRRLHACGNPACVLYFYDRTRNGQRRFCSAATCGNRIKAARRYRRLQARRTG
ncbi:MAG TPA: ABATE domain-containing protein [Gemmatimonadales bacterium]|nr:ABATE domain-containing protein [Gemmatimonadales bacterium]